MTRETSSGEADALWTARGRPAPWDHRHELRTFAPLGLSNSEPLFSDDEGSVNEAFTEVEFAALAEVLGND